MAEYEHAGYLIRIENTVRGWRGQVWEHQGPTLRAEFYYPTEEQATRVAEGTASLYAVRAITATPEPGSASANESQA